MIDLSKIQSKANSKNKVILHTFRHAIKSFLSFQLLGKWYLSVLGKLFILDRFSDELRTWIWYVFLVQDLVSLCIDEMGKAPC